MTAITIIAAAIITSSNDGSNNISNNNGNGDCSSMAGATTEVITMAAMITAAAGQQQGSSRAAAARTAAAKMTPKAASDSSVRINISSSSIKDQRDNRQDQESGRDFFCSRDVNEMTTLRQSQRWAGNVQGQRTVVRYEFMNKSGTSTVQGTVTSRYFYGYFYVFFCS